MRQKRRRFVNVILVIGCLSVISAMSAGCRSQDSLDSHGSQSSQDTSEEAFSSVSEDDLPVGENGTDTAKETPEEKKDIVSAVSAEDAPGGIYIYICGKVVSPGVYELPEGSRVKDAILAAGGMSEQAAKEYLNQAARLSDGQKVYVPSEEEAKEMETSGIQQEGGESLVSTAAEDCKVNLNTAGIAELMSLSGIGESRAEAILAYRKEHGRFERIEDIQKIEGIKEGIYSRIKDRLTV